ncbi:MAG: NlpC/P60 family protein [Actinomycetota bacterium]
MRRTTRGRMVRLLAAVSLALPGVLVSLSTPSSAAPSAADVVSARARRDELNHELERASEAYNAAYVRLDAVRASLADARATRDVARAEAARARAQLTERAVSAYTSFGSKLDVLLGAQDLGQFSDRLEFMGALAQSDAELAATADGAAQRARWAAERYTSLAERRRQEVAAMAQQRARIEALLTEADRVYRSLAGARQDYLDALAAQRAAVQAPPSTPEPLPTPPPADGTAASIAIAAARSVIGTPYVFGAAGPDAFDCSGLTSWAYAQAGVYLPHSADAQYASFPRVPLSDLQPGDIVYYGNYGPHVALYVGGGTIIHATHPGPGGGPHFDSLYGYDVPWGAVRPT